MEAVYRAASQSLALFASPEEMPWVPESEAAVLREAWSRRELPAVSPVANFVAKIVAKPAALRSVI